LGQVMAEAALGDKTIMPVRRYRPDGDAVRVLRASGVTVVQEFDAVWAEMGQLMLERFRAQRL
jgi:hypothetical protein